MQTVEMGRKLSFDFKLTARTAPEMYEAFNHLVLRAAAEGLKFNNRKVGVEAAINAVLIEFFRQPEEVQLGVLKANVPRFEEIMAREDPLLLEGGRLPIEGDGASKGSRGEIEGQQKRTVKRKEAQ